MKNHKGSVPALLTLGLVLVGSLITLGISYLTTTNKIASNPRAAGCVSGAWVIKEDCEETCDVGGCQSCNLGQEKWECTAAVNGTMPKCTEARTFYNLGNCFMEHSEGPCTQCLMNYTPRVESKGEGGEPGGEPGGGPVTCNTAYSTCKAQFGASFGDQQFWQKGDLYYSKKGCSTKVDDNDANTLPGSFNALTGWCKSFQGQICGDVTCEDKYGGVSGVDAAKPLKQDASKVYFLAGSKCILPGPSETDLHDYCFPESAGGGGGGGGGGVQTVHIGTDTYFGCGPAIDVADDKEATINAVCADCGTPLCPVNYTYLQVYCCTTKKQ